MNMTYAILPDGVKNSNVQSLKTFRRRWDWEETRKQVIVKSTRYSICKGCSRTWWLKQKNKKLLSDSLKKNAKYQNQFLSFQNKTKIFCLLNMLEKVSTS